MSNGQNKIQVQVDYPGYWEGTYGDENGDQSVSGTGPQTFDVPDNPSIVSALFQKMDGGSENLTVRILKNGEVLAERSTNADYGIADVCVTTFLILFSFFLHMLLKRIYKGGNRI